MQEVVERNRAFLRARQSDSEESDEDTSIPTLTPSDLAFLSALTNPPFLLLPSSLTHLFHLIHTKIHLISSDQLSQSHLQSALSIFISVYWKAVMTSPALANPVYDIFSSILYYYEKIPWVEVMCREMDVRRRMELLCIELDCIAEEHLIEVDKRKMEGKRNRQLEKWEKMRRTLGDTQEGEGVKADLYR